MRVKIILLGMVLIFAFTLSGCITSKPDSDHQGEMIDVSGEPYLETESMTKEERIDLFVDGYNASASSQLVFTDEFIVSDKESGHYRTEFRLSAYLDAVGRSYKLNDKTVDIIARESMFGDMDVRIYGDGLSLEQCIQMVQNAFPLLDPNLETNTIQETLEYMLEEKEANGYYYGELGLLLLGNDTKGYHLMIKTD